MDLLMTSTRSTTTLDLKSPVRSPRCSIRSCLKQPSSTRRKSITVQGRISFKLSGDRGTIRRERFISFYEYAAVKSIIPARLMTNEPKKLWFQRDEIRRINEKNAQLPTRNGSMLPKGKRYCLRGLERLVDRPSGWRKTLVTSVLTEQEMQRAQGVNDEACIARLYKFLSRESLVVALSRAAKDEREANKILKRGSSNRSRRRMVKTSMQNMHRNDVRTRSSSFEGGASSHSNRDMDFSVVSERNCRSLSDLFADDCSIDTTISDGSWRW